MYNFLDGRLTPNVVVKCPITDGYEASNLISEIHELKSKGFLAFSAIKPPIDIDFKVICPIRLHYIAIWASVDSQKSSGFEILAKTNNSDYTTIGKVFINSAGFAICNRKFYNDKIRPKVPQDFSICYFKGSEYKIFTCTEKIKIRIIRTVSSAPCIGKIEIWGHVARSCTEKTKETINYLMTPRIKPNLKLNSESATTSKTSKTEDFEIPEEYIDPISCETMSIPMTLPSGKTIDQSTLEKHANTEAKWGRSSSDPFTGRIFTSTRKPILNAALKSRIDEFLLKNENRMETKNIQRTVGRRIDINKMPGYIVKQETKRMKMDDSQNSLQSTSSDNLDLAIQQTIQKYNVIRFSNINSVNSQLVKNSCCFCSGDMNMYILLCKHLICRKCLLAIKLEGTCKICSKYFKKSEVVKYHA